MNLNFKIKLDYYLEYGYLHGIRYLGKRTNILGKLYWFTILLSSVIGMVYIFVLSLDRYNKDSVNVNVDTAYLRWTNIFPAISVCLAPGYTINPIKAFVKPFMQERNLTLTKKEVSYYKFIREYVFVTPIAPIDKFFYCDESNSTCGFNLTVLQQLLLPRTCSDFIFNLTFLDKQYQQCEELFKRHETELGICFTANSIYDYNEDVSLLPLKYNRFNEIRRLSFQYDLLNTVRFDLYVHSPEETPNVASLKLKMHRPEYHWKYFVNTIEMMNVPDVYAKTMEQRQCRFPNERLIDSSLPYSFSFCFMQLRINLELKMCNCTLHTSPSNCI